MEDEIVETPEAAPEPSETTETPAVETAETPAVETQPEPPALNWEDEDIRTRAAEALSHIEKWGDPTEVERAIAIDQALRTEEGVTALLYEAGKALGISEDSIKALFGGTEEAAPAEEAPAEPADDETLTWGEAKRLMEEQMERLLTEKVEKPRQEQEQQRAVAAASDAVKSTLAELGVKDDAEVRSVLAQAQAFVGEDELDPDKLKAAVRKGFEEHKSIVQKRSRDYIEGKKTVKETVPSSIKGTAPGGEALPEPKDLAEAKARARKSGLFGSR